jgi:hypothetical protein
MKELLRFEVISRSNQPIDIDKPIPLKDNTQRTEIVVNAINV